MLGEQANGKEHKLTTKETAQFVDGLAPAEPSAMEGEQEIF